MSDCSTCTTVMRTSERPSTPRGLCRMLTMAPSRISATPSGRNGTSPPSSSARSVPSQPPGGGPVEGPGGSGGRPWGPPTCADSRTGRAGDTPEAGAAHVCPSDIQAPRPVSPSTSYVVLILARAGDGATGRPAGPNSQRQRSAINARRGAHLSNPRDPHLSLPSRSAQTDQVNHNSQVKRVAAYCAAPRDHRRSPQLGMSDAGSIAGSLPLATGRSFQNVADCSRLRGQSNVRGVGTASPCQGGAGGWRAVRTRSSLLAAALW
jgi:hypothetical protein